MDKKSLYIGGVKILFPDEISVKKFVCTQFKTVNNDSSREDGRVSYGNIMKRRVERRNDDGIMIETFELADNITYGIPRTFIKNNYLKMHGEPMKRRVAGRKGVRKRK